MQVNLKEKKNTIETSNNGPNLMEQEFIAKFKNYFETRAPEGDRVINGTLIRLPSTKDSIIVGDNNYLYDSEVVMSGAFVSDDGSQGLF
ncbi:hypothetical protein K502DRAFT_353627 [Neoconidiobolus thromboides FSU 785]|nr:hypothetical protein K502DRAFT_353627 [Neoconidiobolus thromboides FSU 785]